MDLCLILDVGARARHCGGRLGFFKKIDASGRLIFFKWRWLGSLFLGLGVIVHYSYGNVLQFVMQDYNRDYKVDRHSGRG